MSTDATIIPTALSVYFDHPNSGVVHVDDRGFKCSCDLYVYRTDGLFQCDHILFVAQACQQAVTVIPKKRNNLLPSTT